MKKLTVIALLLTSVCVKAQNIITKDRLGPENIAKMAGSVYAYEAPTWKLTQAPKGFKPFYLTHFGRHGSRFMDNASNYDRPYNTLKEADDAGLLTDFGKDVLRRVGIIRAEAQDRAGDLTEKGKQQHRDIARRMVENYPELFTKDKTIVARSTTSHRVLVSEYSALMQIIRMRPGMKIDYNSSNYDEPYMYTEDKAVSSHKRKANAAVQEFNRNHTHPERFLASIFTDPSAVKGASSLYTQLYDMASSVQGSDPGVDLYDIFTYDEWYDLFLMNNMRWYSQCAFTPLTDNVVAYGHCVTLQNFLDNAQAAIDGNGVSAYLRYGHEVTLMSFFSLLCLNQSGYSTDNLEEVAEHWTAYNNAHMGGNVQWIFFRNKKGEVIVRFLLNEEEATLPDEVPFYNDMKPFYRWEDVKQFYQAKIDFWQEYKAANPS